MSVCGSGGACRVIGRIVWSLLFLTVPVLGTWAFVVGYQRGWWLPANLTGTGSYGEEIDTLFYIILAITGVVFVITQLVLVAALVRFSGRDGKGTYSHGNHKLEVTWTLATAAILLYVAIAQLDAWAKAKFPSSFADVTPIARVNALQFEWRITYPGPDGTYGTLDDIEKLNRLHVPEGGPVVITLTSPGDGVLHSFFVPELRVKQDAVPGKPLPVFFEIGEGVVPEGETTRTLQILCAELCGWGHSKMRGELVIHTQEDFEDWLAVRAAEEEIIE